MESSSIGAWALPLGAGPEEPANSHGKSLMVRVACLPCPWALACLSVIKMVPCSAMWIVAWGGVSAPTSHTLGLICRIARAGHFTVFKNFWTSFLEHEIGGFWTS